MMDSKFRLKILKQSSPCWAMMLDKEAIAKASEILTSEDFYREAHRVIFNAMLGCTIKTKLLERYEVTIRYPAP